MELFLVMACKFPTTILKERLQLDLSVLLCLVSEKKMEALIKHWLNFSFPL